MITCVAKMVKYYRLFGFQILGHERQSTNYLVATLPMACTKAANRKAVRRLDRYLEGRLLARCQWWLRYRWVKATSRLTLS